MWKVILAAVCFAVPVPNVLTQRPYVSPPSTYRPQPQYVQPRPQQPIYTPSSSSQYEPQPQPTQDTDRFGYFDMELLNAMNMKKTGKGNVFMSPASIKTVLAMILEGAGGASRKEIMSALRVNSVDEARVNINTIHNARNGRSLQSAQALFLSDQYPSSDSLRHYAQLLERHYGASLQLLPFHEPSRAADHVNAWVANATRGFVPSVVRPENFDAAGAVLLVNALYFGGTWLREFNRNLSSVQCFQTPTEPCRKVHMMQQNSNFNYAHLPLLDAHAIELPYSDGVYSMILLVPKTPNQPRLFRELARLSVRELMEPMDSVEIVLRMPKFEIDYSDDMTNILQHLGITQIFSDRANLTGIVSTRSVKVDALIHRARVRVDEQGTVAAAVTAAEVIPLMGSSVLRVDADHPFVFLIVNRHTQSVAFAGIVDAPTQANESPIPQPAPQYPSPFVGGAGKPAYSSGNNYNNNNNAAVLGAPHAAPSTNSQRGGSSSSYRDSYYAVH